MILIILILLSFLVVLLSFITEIQIFYNLKRFSFPNDKTAQKILNFFTVVHLILLGINFFFLFLNFISQ